MGVSLLCTGDMAEGRAHCDRAIALYNPAAHRQLATRFGQDIGVSILSYRSLALWMLGYPRAALADTENALKDAREIGQAATLMYALSHTSFTHILSRDHLAANLEADELVKLANEKGALFWKAYGMIWQGILNALAGEASKAVQMLTSGITAHRSTRSTAWMPSCLTFLAKAHAELGQLDAAWRWIAEAMKVAETTKEKWHEAEIYRIAGEIALMSPEPEVPKAEGHFGRAIAIAREQQAKSWELRASMSMARLWCNQGERQQAHDLLAPVYGWFTEGFDTLDLKEAKAQLDELT
jgi:predicted ATPase